MTDNKYLRLFFDIAIHPKVGEYFLSATCKKIALPLFFLIGLRL